jgi:glycosyltransferase 2 family protein
VTILLRRLILALLLAVVVYGAFVIWTGVQTLGSALADFHWSALGLALLLSSLNYCLRFLKWEYYLRLLGVPKVPTYDSFLVFLSGFVLTVTPGKVGEVFKSAVLQKTHGIDLALTAPIVVGERLTDVIAIVVLVVVGSLGFHGGLLWAAFGALAVIAVLVGILWDAPVSALLSRIERSGGKLAAHLPRIRTARASLIKVAGLRTLPLPTVLSLIGWTAEGIGLWGLLGGFGQDTPLVVALFFYATSTLAGALVPVPGGLGVAETILQGGLSELAGVPAAAATGAMLLSRFATLWWAVLVGFAALGLLRLRFPRALA